MEHLNNIWKYLQQQLGSPEQNKLEEWKDISSENLELFEEVKTIWSESGQIEEVELFETDENWAEFEQMLDQSGELKDKPVQRKPVLRRIGWISVAASVLIVAAIFWFTQEKEIVVEEPLYTSYTALDKSNIVLPDSTGVQLEKGAVLRYFTRLTNDFVDRRVYLDGIATFDVAANDSLPFIVEAGKTGVKVLGTIFLLENKDTSEVYLENIEGLIKFYELANEANAVTLAEGEKFSFNGEAFVDKNVKPEPPKPVVQEVARDYTLRELWFRISTEFEGKIIIHSQGSPDQNKTIRINLDQSPNDLIKELESNPKVQMEYSQTCPDCFEISKIILTN